MTSRTAFGGAGLAWSVVVSAVVLAGCATPPPPLPRGVQNFNESVGAYVDLMPIAGSQVQGRLDVAPFANGVRLSGDLHGFPAAGDYAFHITERGDCSGDGAAAGGIFDPHGTRHGRYAVGEHKLGDMDNLEVGGERQVRLNRQHQGVVLGGGGFNDIAGRSLVIHERADDYTSQPDGSAGRRIACGVINVLERVAD